MLIKYLYAFTFSPMRAIFPGYLVLYAVYFRKFHYIVTEILEYIKISKNEI
jgi:hypothetical protein